MIVILKRLINLYETYVIEIEKLDIFNQILTMQKFRQRPQARGRGAKKSQVGGQLPPHLPPQTTALITW